MKHQSRQPAFTLIEVMAVMVIMGLLAGIAVLSLNSMITVKERSTVMEEWLSADAETRLRARRFNEPMRLDWDASTHTLTYGSADSQSDERSIIQFPEHYQIQLIPDRSHSEVSIHHILITAEGRSTSYQILIQDEQGQHSRYVLGMTGEVVDLQLDEPGATP